MRGSLFSEGLALESASDSDSESESSSAPKRVPQPTSFRCAPKPSKSLKAKNADALFVLDVSPETPEADATVSSSAEERTDEENSAKRKKGNKKKKLLPGTIDDVDPHVKELLSKSIVGIGFEKLSDEGPSEIKSRREPIRRRRAERERTKGNDWFNLPATELTEERERDLEVLQMRDALDTKVHYKKNDRSVLPKYFQVGTIIESKADFYSSRIPKKLRKRTMVEELMADAEFQTKQKKKYQEIKAREAMTRKGAFQRRSYPKRKRRLSHH